MRKWRLVVLTVAAIVLIALALGYRHYWLARPVGRGPAGPPVPRQPFSEVWTEREVLLLRIGDSVTAGFGASPGRSYFECLVQDPEGECADYYGDQPEPETRGRGRTFSGRSLLPVTRLSDFDPRLTPTA